VNEFVSHGHSVRVELSLGCTHMDTLKYRTAEFFSHSSHRNSSAGKSTPASDVLPVETEVASSIRPIGMFKSSIVC
jgi:hypothetical protein